MLGSRNKEYFYFYSCKWSEIFWIISSTLSSTPFSPVSAPAPMVITSSFRLLSDMAGTFKELIMFFNSSISDFFGHSISTFIQFPFPSFAPTLLLESGAGFLVKFLYASAFTGNPSPKSFPVPLFLKEPE